MCLDGTGTVDTVRHTANPGTLLVNQKVNNIFYATRTDHVIMLDNPVAVVPNQELWVGLRMVYHSTHSYAIVYDTTCIPGQSNLIIDGNGDWDLIEDCAWYLHGIFTDASDLISYNIYRNNTLLTNISGNCYIDSLDTDGTHSYEVRTLSANGVESSGITDSLTYTDKTIDTLPYSENFDAITGSTSSTYDSHIMPEGWNWVCYGYNYSGYPQVYANSSNAASGTNSLRFYTYNTSSTSTNPSHGDQYAVLPPVDTTYPVNTLQLEFDARCSNSSGTYQLMLLVGVMDAPNNPFTFEVVDTIVCTGTAYNNYEVNLSGYTGTGRYIALMAPSRLTGSTNYVSGYVDNLLLDIIPTCPKPSNLAVIDSTITQNSVELTWHENGTATQWIVEYGPMGFTQGEGTNVLANDTVFTVTGLSASTFYNFYVRAYCSSGDTSHYSFKASTRTNCGVLSSLPYTQNFDAVTGTTSTTANNLDEFCWNYLNTGTNYTGYPIAYNSSTYSRSGSNSLRFYRTTASTYGDQYAISPALDVTTYPMNTLQISLFARKYSTYESGLVVGVMSDSSNVSTFVPIDTLDVNSADYQEFIVTFENYTGNARFIVLKSKIPSRSYYCYVDDITISEIPSCRKPMDVTVDTITSTTAEVSWTSGGSESQWEVIYGTNVNLNVDQPSVVYSNVATLTGLTPNTLYTVYVRAVCNNSDYSVWESSSFRTECTPLSSIPFSDDFESYDSGTDLSNVTPSCWYRINTGTLAVGCPTVYSNSIYFHSGTKGLFFYSTPSNSFGDQYSILPELDTTSIQLNTLRLSLYARRYNTTSTYQNYVVVGVMTDKSDANTFVPVDTITFLTTNIERYYADFIHYTGNGSYIAIKAPKPSGPFSYNYTYLDDISLNFSPSCISPTNLTMSNISQTGATATWTAGGYER